MDPITIVSLGATVAQLIDATSKVIRYINDVKNAPKERGKLAREISNLLPLFTDLRYRIDESNTKDSWFHGLQSLGGKGSPLEAFQSTMEEIATKLEPSSSVRKLTQTFSWTFDKKEVERLLARIERLKSLIGLALQKDNFKLAQAIKDDVSTGFESLEIERDATRLTQWLAAPDPSLNHNAARKKWQPTTGEWFTDSKDFTQWKTVPNSFLWLHGIPGSGKTVLCSTVIQNVVELSRREPSTAVAYFYFDFNDLNKQRTESFLRSVLAQLSACSPSPTQSLQDAYAQSQDGRQQPTTEAMIFLLRQMLEGFGQTFLICDALDECRDRDEIHELFAKITQWDIGTLHILATSRKEKDIEDSILPLVSCQICIQSALVNADIQVFISEKLVTDSKLKKWPVEAKGEMEAVLMAGANGMFRWVVCQLDSLRKCLTLDALRKALRALPKTLDKTYERILSEIDDTYADDALKVLQWLCYSERPMTLIEMVDVLATDLRDKSHFSPDQRLPDPRDILTICSSLVSITEGKDQWHRQQHYLRLAHFSVKEFLISDRVKDASIQHYACTRSCANVTIVRTCLAYLAYFASFDMLHDDHPQRFPLYQYAAENWTNHFMVSMDDESRVQMDSLAVSFFQSNNDCFYNWVRTVTSRTYVSDLGDKSRPHPLYYLSLLGFTELASLLLEEGANLVFDGKRYYCEHDRLPGPAASNELSVPQLPIYDKAGLNAPGGRYGSALQAASYRGHITTVELLLDWGANIDAQGGKALRAAIDSRQLMQLLLARSGNARAQDEDVAIALRSACYNGQQEIVQLLLDHGANVNNKGDDSKSPLRSACLSGNLEIARMLLHNGADVNAQLGSDGDALQVAARKASVSVVQLLLDWGADINAQGGFFGNALQAASFGGNRELVRLLIKRGADVNIQGGEYGSALQAAAYQGNVKVVRLLIKRGADVNAKSGKYGSALQAACRNKTVQVIQVLLDQGADVDAQGKDSDCALWLASCSGEKRLVRILLDAGANPDGLGKDGSHALQMAMLEGHKEVALLLLQSGANADAPGREQGTVRQWNYEEAKYDKVTYSSWKTMGLEELREQVL